MIAKVGITRKGPDVFAQRVGVIGIHHEGCIPCHLRNRPFGGRKDWGSELHGFQDWQPKTFIKRWKQNRSRTADQAHEQWIGDEIKTMNLAPRYDPVLSSGVKPEPFVIDQLLRLITLPAGRSNNNEGQVKFGGQISLDEAGQVLFRFKRTKKQKVFFPGEIENSSDFIGGDVVRFAANAKRYMDGLIGIRNPVFLDIENADDIPA